MSTIWEELTAALSAQGSRLTKTQVTSVLCRLGVESGLSVIPECPTRRSNSTKGIAALDIAWGHHDQDSGWWHLVAAFEIDGQHIDKPGKKVSAFRDAQAAGATRMVHVLFRRSEAGKVWGKTSKLEKVRKAYEQAGLPVDVVLDEGLPGLLQAWEPQLGKQR